MTERRRAASGASANGSAASANGALAKLRAEEAAVDALEAAGARLRTVARDALAGPPAPRLRDAIGASQAGWSTVIVLAAFVALDQVLSFAFTTLGPHAREAMGLSSAAYGVMVSQRANAAVGTSLFMAAQLHRKASMRKVFAVQTAAATGVGAVLAAMSHSYWPLMLSVLVSGPTAGVVWAVHRPMVMDGYQPQVRVRAMCLHQAGVVIGAVAAPAVVAALTGPFGLTWRGVLLVVGVAGVVLSFAGVKLRDPAVGRHDEAMVRSAVRVQLESPGGAADEESLGFFETLRRLWLIPTVKRLLGAWAVLGIVLTPLFSYASSLLADRFNVGAGGRSVVTAAAWACALPALVWLGRRGDALLRESPGALLELCARLLTVLAGGLLVLAVAPVTVVAAVGFGVVLACASALIAALMVTTLTIVPPEARAHAGALVATFLVAVGGQGGAAVLGGVDHRFGPAAAIVVLIFPALAASALVRRSARTVDHDVDQLLDRVVEEEEVRAMTGRGVRLPMLSCRHIDFSYGQLQVLFDINFTVDDGEIVALLGTNGAGKSTLLRVVSGLGMPSRGSVRFRGGDITYLDAERRVGLGISQVPGGRAVFGPLTVVDNLRAMGFNHGRNRRAVEAGIEASFEAFPRLAERRNQLASTLSGGEQQMLGLSTAFIMRPRLLLIDELSLGLAPIIVGELLDMVRRINAAGTAVVLVEQSVNVALSVVKHAYFMEKGEIRFDGVAAELLARPDLLRSVFLEGASKGLARA